MSYNNISSVSDVIFPSSLTYLSLLSNSITSLPALRFTDPNSVSLQGLHLATNPFSNISGDVFSHLTNLTYLDLSGIPLTSASVDQLSLPASLVILNLGSTGLTHLPSNLPTLPKLRNLVLDGMPRLTCDCHRDRHLLEWYQEIDPIVQIDGDCHFRFSIRHVEDFLSDYKSFCFLESLLG